MDQGEALFKEIDDLFHPRSVAVVGVPRGMKAGKLFLLALLDQGFSGPIYPVQPHAEEIDGLKAYPSVSAIPGPVDLAIVLVSHDQTLPVIRECAAKGVKGVILFTAGYRELGTEEGLKKERELVEIARAAGMRLVGPNCMGLYAPGAGLAFFPELSRERGDIGLVSHSGSLANILCHYAPKLGLRFSKAVSLGNECDLTSADFFFYLGEDPDTRLIGAYIESVGQGTRLFTALRGAARKKPVILWKVGLTPEGARAASSHTGALGGAAEIWQGIVKQTGVIPVVGFEDWVDALVGFSFLNLPVGEQLAIVSGPGGLAVAAAEACATNGLKLAEINEETKALLREVIPPTGTSLRNPIDVGLTASLDLDIYIESTLRVAADPGVDGIVIIGTALSAEMNRKYAEALVDTQRKIHKPFVVVGIPIRDQSVGEYFYAAGIPFFPSVERAMRTYARVHAYQKWARIHGWES